MSNAIIRCAHELPAAGSQLHTEYLHANRIYFKDRKTLNYSRLHYFIGVHELRLVEPRKASRIHFNINYNMSNPEGPLELLQNQSKGE